MNILDIPKERRLEIDKILRETEKNIKLNLVNSISLEEFMENKKKIDFTEAIWQSNIETVRMLLENDADPNYTIKCRLPKDEFASETPVEMLEFLREMGWKGNVETQQ